MPHLNPNETGFCLGPVYASLPNPPRNAPAAFEPARAVSPWRYDLPGFASAFFRDLCHTRWSPLHEHLFERRRARGFMPPGQRTGAIEVTLAPRGAAKSTLVSLVFPIHALLHQLEPYIVLIAATQGQATRLLTNLRLALTEQEGLAEAFPDVFGDGPRHTLRTLELGSGRIDAVSAGSEIRGFRHRAWRPTWIILDDVERSDRIHSERYRNQLSDWFTRVVEPLGAKGTNIDLVGTLLHRDALPARLLRRPDVTGSVFKSILAEAEDDTLWAEWRARLHDLNDPDRLATARRYFEERQEAMLKGSEVLWPENEDYYALCLAREARGRAAFDQEKQNEPHADGRTLFNPRRMRRFRLADGLVLCDPPCREEDGLAGPGDGLAPQFRLEDLRRYGFLDPALGGKGGDFAAIVTVGVNAQGYMFLLDAWLERASPSDQVVRIYELDETWRYDAFGLETNGFQAVLRNPIEAMRRIRRVRGQRWQLPVTECRHRGDKVRRIAALEPHISSGWLLFRDDLPEELMRQLREFPGGLHDDGPDALAAAVELARDKPLLNGSLRTLQRTSREY